MFSARKIIGCHPALVAGPDRCRTPSFFRYALVLCLGFLLAGCIIVDDFKGFWNKGSIDPLLEGQWKEAENSEPSIVFVRNKEDYSMAILNEAPPAEVIRTLHIGPHKFLMVKSDKNNPGGDLIRYSTDGGVLKFYSPNPAKKEEFLKFYKLRVVVIDDETMRLTEINTKIISMLQYLTAKPDYWQVTGSYTKAQ